jgi:ankyrin repeat protein
MRATYRGGWLMVPLLAVVSLGAAAAEVPLIEAVKKTDKTAVRAQLQKRADVNATEADGSTALHWAARRNDLETAGLLIRAGANVKAANRFGVTPLALAATTGGAAMVELLLKSGADPNSTSAEGEPAIMTAALTGRVDVLQTFLAHGAKVDAKESWKGQTALMWAAAEGHAAAVRVLIKAGADINARAASGQFTPLLFAIREGHIDAVRALLEAGANPRDQITKPFASKYGPVGNETVVTSALALAIINAHYELAALLLEKGADPNVSDARGSVLHALAWMRRPGLPDNRDFGAPAPTGHLDSLELAKLLLAKGAKPNTRIAWKEIRFDRDDGEAMEPPDITGGRNYLSYVGATPFYLAARNGDVALMRLLAANGADPLIGTVQNVTPLMAASGLGSWEGESPGPLSGTTEAERLEAVKLAYELGGDVNAVTDFGDIPVVGDGVELLRRYPDNLEEFPETALGDMRWGGSTALHGAVTASSQHSIIHFLLEKGARLDARNKLGWTPLMMAEGMVCGSLQKTWPETAELVRKLMRERNLDPDQYNQRAAAAQTAARRRQ